MRDLDENVVLRDVRSVVPPRLSVRRDTDRRT
jgi:hypothetical protein